MAGKYIYDYNELERGNMYVITMNQREEICMWLQWMRGEIYLWLQRRKYVYVYDYDELERGNMITMN